MMSDLSPGIYCVIPVYNNGTTVKDIALKCREMLPNVVVVDDGSTDTDVAGLLSDTGIPVLKHDRNRGKGRAIMTGLEYVHKKKGTWMITIDADGQHYPEDIRKFLPLLTPKADSLIIGSRDFSDDHIPGGSRFGRKFAGFWLKVETNNKIDDCQSGFRAYPVSLIKHLPLSGKHYDFEAEILAKASWAGIHLKTVPVRVWYPKPEEKRITSFKPFTDNFRLTLMHSKLVGRRLLPVPHRQLVKRPSIDKEEIKNFLNPLKLISRLLRESTTPEELGVAAALGVLIGALPIFGFHSVVIIYVAARLHFNKIMALASQNICIPPVVPAICIELGYYIRNGRFLTDISATTIFLQVQDRLFEWLLGSLIIGPVLAAVTGILIYFSARYIAKARLSH